MRRRGALQRFGGLLAAFGALAAPAIAQSPPVPPTFASAAIPLGTGNVPDGSPEIWTNQGKLWTVRNVTEATLTPVLPAAGKGTGTAVVIAPGGAFRTLAMDLEGWTIARWLADHGIAAFVLKYRLVPTPADPKAFGREMAEVMRGAALRKGEVRKIEVPAFAIADGTAALKVIRQGSKEFGVDPARVGMMGFSAGAITTIQVALTAQPNAEPAFIAPIYPSMNAVEVPPSAPPMFVALAADDPLFSRQGYGLVESWVLARKKVEFHLFQQGGHGFGSGKPTTTSAEWLSLFLRWLDANNLLHPRA